MGKLFGFLKKLWFPLIIFVSSTIVFFVLLFPLNDLTDMVSTQVARATANQVYFQFDNLSLSALPPGLQMEKVYLETPQIPSLKAQEITLLPSLIGMMKSRPYGKVSATGFLKGDVNLSVSSGPKSEKGTESALVEFAAKKVSVKEMKNLLGLPFALQGTLNMDSKAVIPFAIKEQAGQPSTLVLEEQPDMDLSFMISKFELPPTNVEIPNMGALTLPELKLKQMDFKGKLSNGNFVIEKGEFGQAGDELQASIKGNIRIDIQSRDGRLFPILGSYNLDIDLRTQKSFQDKAGIFLTFIQSYQKSPGVYRFKVASPQWGMAPQISALR